MNRVARQVFLHSNGNRGDVDKLIITDHITSVDHLKREAADRLDAGGIVNIAPEKVQVAILGAGGVGKSAITLRFMRDSFVNNWEATIEDAYRKNIRVDDETSVIEILDTAGQEDFTSLRAQWMKEKDGFIFVYSLLDKLSLTHLKCYVDLLEQVTNGMNYLPPVAFVGNKKDIVDQEPDLRQVSHKDIEELLTSYRSTAYTIKELNNFPQDPVTNPVLVTHFETSALSGESIDDMFEFIVREIRKLRRPEPVVPPSCCILF